MLDKHEMNCQWVIQNCGYNSGMPQSRGKNKKCQEDIPFGISILDWDVHKGEEVIIDNIFRVL